MHDTLNKYNFVLSLLLIPSLAQGLWEPDLKHEDASGQEPVLLSSTSAAVIHQGESTSWPCSSPAVPPQHDGHALPPA